MKSEIVMKEEGRKYPWLGIADDGDIVLFIKENCGVVIRNADVSDCYVGYYEEEWWMDRFKYFKGKVILSND